MSETGRGGMPRISEQLQWNDDAAKKRTAYWGCPNCGNEDSRVVEVDRDSDFIRVRLRICVRCETRWATEERRLRDGPEAFFARAETRRYASFRKKRYTDRKCLVCHERYMSGQYLEHTQESDAHRVRLEVKARRRAEKERRYRRIHARATRAIRKVKEGTAVCYRCGERYPMDVPYPQRTHAGTSKEHRRVVREEAAARKDRRIQAAKRGKHVQSAA